MSRRKIFNALLRPFGFKAYRISKAAEYSFLKSVSLDHKINIVHEISSSLQYTVQRGPFMGLKLPHVGTWSDHDIASKLIGSYECELFEVIEDLTHKDIGCVVNIGASEGYYAIGLKKILPEITSYTYDIDKASFAALDLCQTLNDIQVVRLNDFDFSNPTKNFNATIEGQIAFIVDCEGCELNILKCPKNIANSANFVIELHEMFSPGVTKKLVDFLKDSHNISIIDQRPRDINEFPELEKYNDIQRFILMHEYRASRMQWLYVTPKSV